MSPRNHLILSAAATAVLALGSAARADLVVNQDLGLLGSGNHAFAGTTVGGASNADTYSPPGNTAAIWDQEFVYQFTINQQMIAGVTTNDPNGAIDNDFFLLNSLTTFVNGNGLNNATVVHDNLVEVSGSFGVLDPGTYYLSIDAWRGVPGGTTPPSGRAGPFSGTLDLAVVQAPNATPAFVGGSLSGSLGAAQVQWWVFDYNGTDPLVIDTEGSTLGPSNDTEIGLYDATGNLVMNDDDSGTGLLSLLNATGSPAGRYYLALGGFNTTFGSAAWQVTTTSTNTGNFNVNGLSIPEPGSLALLGLTGLTTLRRRRA